MKKLIIILSMLFGIAEAQTITYTPQIAAGYRFKYAIADSGFTVPFGDTTTGRGSVRPGAIKLFQTDSLLYFWNGVKWTKVNAGSISGPNIDSIVFTSSTICKWFAGASTCFDLGLVHANSSLSYDSTKMIFYNLTADPVDSTDLPHTDVYAGDGFLITDTLGTAKLFTVIGGSGSTTDDSTLVAEASQTDFTFPSVPASKKDYIIYINGSAIDPIYFTAVGNTITFIDALDADDRVRFKRIK